MFHVIVKKAFRASHALKKGGKKIEPCHGHEWLCEAILSSDKLDKTGCVVDFKKADDAIDRILLKLEQSENESSETMAKQIYDSLSKIFKVSSVCVWEDDCHGAKYSQ